MIILESTAVTYVDENYNINTDGLGNLILIIRRINLMSSELHHYNGVDRKSNKAEVDPITTQIVRNSLNSAAEQMKRRYRTAISL